MNKKVGKDPLFSVKKGARVRLHSNVWLDAVDLRLKKKDNKKTHEVNVGNWDSVNSL